MLASYCFTSCATFSPGASAVRYIKEFEGNISSVRRVDGAGHGFVIEDARRLGKHVSY